MDKPTEDPDTSEQPETPDSVAKKPAEPTRTAAEKASDERREKFLAAMKGERTYDTNPRTQGKSTDGVRRRGQSAGKGKVRRRPRKV